MQLSGAVLTTDASVSVSGIVAADNIPFRDNFDIQIDSEVMTVIANNASSFTVLRGRRGTAIAAHASGTAITNVTGKTTVYPDSITDTKGRKVLLDSSLQFSSAGFLGINDNLVTDTDGTTVTIDRQKGKLHQVTLAGNRTFVFANMAIGKSLDILITQDGTGSRTVTWPSGIKWAGGSAPTLTTTATKSDLVHIVQTDATHYIATVAQAF